MGRRRLHPRAARVKRRSDGGAPLRVEPRRAGRGITRLGIHATDYTESHGLKRPRMTRITRAQGHGSRATDDTDYTGLHEISKRGHSGLGSAGRLLPLWRAGKPWKKIWLCSQGGKTVEWVANLPAAWTRALRAKVRCKDRTRRHRERTNDSLVSPWLCTDPALRHRRRP